MKSSLSMLSSFRCATSSLLLAALGLTGCVAPTIQPPPAVAKGELPKILSKVGRGANYGRSVQTEPDTYIVQTGYRVFKPASGQGPEVELLGAIHVGEPAYYQQLQKRMDAAECVLYEGIGDETKAQKKLTPKEKAKKLAGTPYQKLADFTGLSHQDLNIDYKRKHFENCDLTIQQMRAILDAEVALGGQGAVDAKRAIKEFSRTNNILVGNSMLFNLMFWAAGLNFNKAGLRLMVAVSACENYQLADPLLSPRVDRLAVEDRNNHVIKELSHRLKKRPKVKKILVFYGAAHLPGMEKSLIDLGYVPSGPVKWLGAHSSHPYAEGLDQDEVTEVIREAQNED
jgi:hypothetical protein